MASHKATRTVPVEVPTSEEIIAKLDTISANKVTEILPKFYAALLCDSTLLLGTHSTLVQDATSTLQDVFPTINLEDIISSVTGAEISSKASCDTLALAGKLMHNKAETAKSCTDNVLNTGILEGSKPVSSNEDDLTCVDNSPVEMDRVTETPQECVQQTRVSRYCEMMCQWEIQMDTVPETSASQVFTPNCVAAGSAVSNKLSDCELQQNVTCVADKDSIQQCRPRRLFSSTPKITDPVGESQGFPVSQFLAEEQIPDSQSDSNSQSSDMTTSRLLWTPGDTAIIQKLQLGSVSECDDEDPMPGSMSSSKGEETSATPPQKSTSRSNTNERAEPLQHEAEHKTLSDVVAEDESDPCNTSSGSHSEACGSLHSAESPQDLPGNGKPEGSPVKSATTMTKKTSLFGASESSESETAVKHKVSDCDADLPCNKRTLSNLSQDSKDNQPLKKPCPMRVNVISPVVKLTRLSPNLISRISDIGDWVTQPNVHKNGATQRTTAVATEYKCSEGSEQRSKEHTQCLSNYSHEGSDKVRSSIDAPESVDRNVSHICERESPDTEADSVAPISVVQTEQEQHSEARKICEPGEHDKSLEATDLEREATVSTRALEGTSNVKESVVSSGNKSEVSGHDESNNATESIEESDDSFPCLPTGIQARESDASVVVLSEEAAATNAPPAREMRRRRQKTSGRPTVEISLQARMLEHARDQEGAQNGNCEQVVNVRCRRKPIAFSGLEEEAIFYGVAKYAGDNMIWKKIHMEGGFVGRKTTDLRDKFRNLESNPEAYKFVKSRVKEKREQKINPLKELREYNKNKKQSLTERDTLLRYAPLFPRRLENCAFASSKTQDDETVSSDEGVTLVARVRESEEQKGAVPLRGTQTPNSVKSGRGQKARRSPWYSKRTKKPTEISAKCPAVSTTKKGTSSTSGRATVTEADVDDRDKDSVIQDSSIEGSPPSAAQGTSVATRGTGKRKFYCDAEVEALVYGVVKYGRGHWALIKRLGGFHDRSSIDLSDKYRNLERSAKNLSKLKDKVREKERKGKNPLEMWKNRSAQR
ncbi:uncharacterized protein LOC135396715 [Ornithodoros turicata]|uniref:uncharacterized protein LOC135375719 n=1 Tax=Ornithodoros turicata TaxID=34597 RepID=UPI00313927F8